MKIKISSIFRDKKGNVLVWVCVIFPLIIWLFTEKIDAPFSGLGNTIASIGEISGLLGITAFSITTILSARLPVFERIFPGINKVYDLHHTLGQVSLVLLLIHPLTLLPRYATNAREAFDFLLWGGDIWARNFGILALWTMVVLVSMSVYATVRPTYHIWKTLHKWLGVALFLGALHVYLIPGYVLNNPLLKGYVLFFAVIGIGAFLYRTIFMLWRKKRYVYTVTDITRLNDDVMEITLTPTGVPMHYTAGQFVFILFEQQGIKKEAHPFSITSAPREPHLTVAIKRLGNYTNTLFKNLRVGTRAYIEGPFGSFSYAPHADAPQVWIAGGVGITPFLSFAKDICIGNGTPPSTVHIVYCVRNKREAVFLRLLKQISKKVRNTHINVIPFFSDERGHIQMDNIADALGEDMKCTHFFLCAPPAMIRALSRGLRERGVPEQRIHSEMFNL